MINKAQNMIIDNAVRAVMFMTNVRRPFTVKELSDSIGLANQQGGRKYLDALSSHFQIYEHEPFLRGGDGWKKGAIAAKYGIIGVTDHNL